MSDEPTADQQNDDEEEEETFTLVAYDLDEEKGVERMEGTFTKSALERAGMKFDDNKETDPDGGRDND